MLETARRQFGADLRIEWHAFELRPDPIPLPDPDRFRDNWQNRILPMAADRGLTMRMPRRRVRSAKALETAVFAREKDRFDEVDRALFRARFEHDDDLGDVNVLAGIARDAGLDGKELLEALASESYTHVVREDRHRAERLGINGVPAMLVTSGADGRLEEAEPVVGAVPFEGLEAAVKRALSG